ncbi:MAG TPA: MYG1 family protein [Candidatus Paceibacterota bacterium]
MRPTEVSTSVGLSLFYNRSICYIIFVMFNFLKPKITVATHNGSFHADDVFACATLSIWAGKKGRRIKIIRTRDEKAITRADIVVDVGMEYDPTRNRFDHHQKGGAGIRENNLSTDKAGIPYASFGLVWKHYGEKICDSRLAEIVEKEIVLPIDAKDNGVNIYNSNELGINDYSLGNALMSMNPTWEENDADTDKQFNRAVVFAKEILKREIASAKAHKEGERLTKEAIEKQDNPEILILDKYFNWGKTVMLFKKVKFVVYKHRNGNDWCVQSGRDNIEDFNSDRANLPEEWGGLRDKELIKISGIRDAVFSTNGGWFGIARSKEGAIEMANKALGK